MRLETIEKILRARLPADMDHLAPPLAAIFADVLQGAIADEQLEARLANEALVPALRQLVGERLNFDDRIIAIDSNLVVNSVETLQQITVQTGGSIGSVIGTQLVFTIPPLQPMLHQLRAPVSDFVGRRGEIEKLVEMLCSSASAGGVAAITGVRGMGGIGKTELAFMVAQQLVPHFPDAQIVVQMRGASPDPLTAVEALQYVIRSFEPEAKLSADENELAARFRSRLAGKRVLLIADDAQDEAQIDCLRPPVGSALLVTSRRRLLLPGSESIDLGTLSESEAIAFVLAVCPRIGTYAPQLARLCGCLPLALRVSASYLASDDRKSIERYLRQLEQERMKRLRDPTRPDGPQASVEASLMLSYQALDVAAQDILSQMSVFPASFDLLAAAAVVGDEDLADDTLGKLRQWSLLEWDAADERYAMHDLVREFSAGLLTNPEPAQERHASFYAQLATAIHHTARQGGEHLLNGLASFDRERPNIEAGWSWARGLAGDVGADRLVLTYATAATDIGPLRLDIHQQRIPMYESARAAARRLSSRRDESIALSHMGTAYYQLGDYTQALEYHSQALAMSEADSDEQRVCAELNHIGVVYRERGDLDRALDHFERALTKARFAGAKALEELSLGNLGIVSTMQGQPEQAIVYHEQAAQIARSTGNIVGQRRHVAQLGSAHQSLGHIDQAIAYYEESLALSRAIRDRRSESVMLATIGLTKRALGLMDEAIAAFTESLVLARATNFLLGQARQLDNLAEVYFAIGRTQEAVEEGRQAYELACQLGVPRERCFHGLTFGWALISDKQFAEACTILADAAAQPVPQARHQALVALGVAQLHLGEPSQAEESLRQAEQHATQLVTRTAGFYKGWLTIGLARAGLALAGKTTIDQVADAYRRALSIAPHAGVVERQRLLLSNLTPLDPHNLLTPIHALLGSRS